MRKKIFGTICLGIALIIGLIIRPMMVSATPTTVTSILTIGGDDTTYDGAFDATYSQAQMGKNGSTSSNNLLLFRDIAIPQGATITSAYFSYSNYMSNTTTVNLLYAAVAADDPVAPVNASEFLADQANLTTAQVGWTNLPIVDYGVISTTPDLSQVVQEVVNRSGWTTGNNILLWIGDNNSDTWTSRKYLSADYGGSTEEKPRLVITYENNGETPTPTVTAGPTPTMTLTPTPTLTPTASLTPTMTLTPTARPSGVGTSLVMPITSSGDDASYDGTTFNNTDSQVRMGKINGSTPINNFFRFNNLTIPKGAQIISAHFSYANFTANSTTVNLQLAAMSADNPAAPTNATDFANDQNALTTAKVNWDNLAVAEYGDIFTSPDMTTVVQEIVDRTGWNSGNSILLWVGDHESSNWSQRIYLAYDNNGGEQKPTLDITYTMAETSPSPTVTGVPPTSSLTPTTTSTPTPTLSPTATITPTTAPTGVGLSLAAEVTASGNDSNFDGTTFSSTETQMVIGKSDTTTSVNGIFRFTNLGLLPGATIISAYFSFPNYPTTSTVANWQLAAVAGDNLTAPTSAIDFANDQNALTTAKVNWDNVPAAPNWEDVLTSPNLATIVQEMVDRSDWTSGDSILLWVGDHNSDAWVHRKVLTADIGVEIKPKLVINYLPANTPPVAVDDISTTLAGEAVTINVLANDYDNENDSLTLTSVATPDHGQAAITNNQLTYTPNSNFSGTETLTYTITDARGATAQGSASVTVMAATGRYSYTYRINKSQVPSLYYRNLTLKLYLGTASNVSVTADGQAISSTFNSQNGWLTLTTSGTTVVVTFDKSGNLAEIGQPIKAVLKDDKKWAWSLSLDDNVYLKNEIVVLQNHGYRGTLYLIGNKIGTTVEDWIDNAPDLQQLLVDGWSLGNHTYNHSCTGLTADGYRQDVIDGQTTLNSVVAGSNVPSYKVIGFAAPCFLGDYSPIIQQMITDGVTDIRFNESSNDYQMIVDSDSSNFSQGSITAKAFNLEIDIGRDSDLTSATTHFDWMANNADSSHHFWYNNFSHGNDETNWETIASYAQSNYGSNGTNEMWQAPADEIYSYFLTRNNATVSFSGGSAVAGQATVAPTASPTVVPLNLTEVTALAGAGTINVSWQSNRSSSSRVIYSLESDLSPYQINQEAALTTNHQIDLTNLSACTKYYYQVSSTIGSQTTTGEIKSGVTTGCLGESTVAKIWEEKVTDSGNGSATFKNDSNQLAAALSWGEGFGASQPSLQVKQLTNSSVITAAVLPETMVMVDNQVFSIQAFDASDLPMEQLGETVTITMSYNRQSLGGINEDSLKIYWWSGSSWQALSKCVVNKNSQSVSCQSNHFSTFALLGQTKTEAATTASTVNSKTTASAPSCDLTAPLAPELYQIRTRGTTAKLYFKPVSNADSYVVAYGDTNKSEGYGLSFNVSGKVTGALSVEIDYLKINSSYSFKVRGGNGCQPGGWSQVIKITTSNAKAIQNFYPTMAKGMDSRIRGNDETTKVIKRMDSHLRENDTVEPTGVKIDPRGRGNEVVKPTGAKMDSHLRGNDSGKSNWWGQLKQKIVDIYRTVIDTQL